MKIPNFHMKIGPFFLPLLIYDVSAEGSIIDKKKPCLLMNLYNY